MKKLVLLSIVLIFAFGSHSQAYISHSNYKYIIAKDIFNEVASAFGSSLAPPSFEINSKNNSIRYIASYLPGNVNLIIIDEELYDLTTAFAQDSTDALASIISHELAHYYQRHNFCSDFAFILGNENPLAKRITKLEKSLKEKTESEADYYGMFYGYMAGYNTFTMFNSVLDRIYNYYKLPDKIDGYPTKNERKSIAIASEKRLEEWRIIFDAGELLFSLKKYHEAFICFNRLTEVFPSREIINNAGVMKLYSAIEILMPNQLPFILPIEFDAGTRLKRGNVRDVENNEELILSLTRSAIALFEKSLQIDPDYTNSQVNLGCAYLLMKNYNLVIGISNKVLWDVKTTADSKTISRFYTLRGLSYYYLGDSKRALEDFLKAKETDNNSVTGYNLQLYEKSQEGPLDQIYNKLSSLFKNQQLVTQKDGSVIKFYETIDKLNPSVMNFPNNSKSIILDIDNESTTIKYHNANSYNQLAINAGAIHLNSVYTQFGYTGKTAGNLGVYDTENALLKSYGEPSYRIESVSGKYMVYKMSKIIFYLSRTKKINKWWIYEFN
jgi:tetratricopeptide (TPR) repeat protein